MIVAGINEPDFQEVFYNILDFGARADPEFNSTLAINKAIETCSKNVLIEH